jgi:hypothetical protein
MAIVTEPFVSELGATIFLTYNDNNGVVSAIRVVNTSGRTYVVEIRKDVGQALHELTVPTGFDQTFPMQGQGLTFDKIAGTDNGWGCGFRWGSGIA